MSVGGTLLFNALQRRPALLLLVTGLLRRTRPILGAGRSYLVCKDADVREVLERGDDFELGPVNGPKMLCGEFLLGMDPSSQYHGEKRRVRQVLQDARQDFRGIVEEVCTAAAADLLRGGRRGRRHRIDVVTGYAELVPARVVQRFFGVSAKGAKSAFLKGSEEDVLRLWLRKVGSVIAGSWPPPFGARQIAERCKEEFQDHFQRQLAAPEPGAPGRDVLTRLLGPASGRRDPREQDFVWRNLAGMVLAGCGPLAKSFTQILVQLLRRPESFELAVKAATTDDGRTLRALALEAMRFHPTFLVLPRYCPRDTTLAAHTPRRTPIPAGSVVYCLTVAAMFDPEAVPEPEVFRPGRDYAYLHFGTGGHRCIADEVDLVMPQLERMLRHFLALRCFAHGDARRIRGRWGRPHIRYDGPAVDRLWLRVPL